MLLYLVLRYLKAASDVSFISFHIISIIKKMPLTRIKFMPFLHDDIVAMETKEVLVNKKYANEKEIFEGFLSMSKAFFGQI